MQGYDCDAVYKIDDLHELEVPRDVIVKVRKRIQEVEIAKDKKLKWCPTPDCKYVFV